MLNLTEEEAEDYHRVVQCLEKIALHLQPERNHSSGRITIQRLSRHMQLRLIILLNCDLKTENALQRICVPIRKLSEAILNDLSEIYQMTLQTQLLVNLSRAIVNRKCMFLGPVLQDQVLKLILLLFENGAKLTKKIMVQFVVKRLQPNYPQLSDTTIEPVIQILYQASCFKEYKCAGSSSLMQLKEEFRTYMKLRREHDLQIVEMAQDSGLRVTPEFWSAMLYGDEAHKYHMQSVIMELHADRSLTSYVQETAAAMYRHGNIVMDNIMITLFTIADLDTIYDGTETMSWARLALVINALDNMLSILCEPPPPPLVRRVPFNDEKILRLFDYKVGQESNNRDQNEDGREDNEDGREDNEDGREDNEDGREDNGNCDNDHEYIDEGSLYSPDNELDEIENPYQMVPYENGGNDDSSDEYSTDDTVIDMYTYREILIYQRYLVPAPVFRGYAPNSLPPRAAPHHPMEMMYNNNLVPAVQPSAGPYYNYSDNQYHDYNGPVMPMASGYLGYPNMNMAAPHHPMEMMYNNNLVPAVQPSAGPYYNYSDNQYHDFNGPVMPMASGYLGYPNMNMAAPHHPMEMMYNNNLVPAVQPSAGPYYNYLDNQYHAMYQPGYYGPAPQQFFGYEQAYNYGAMTGAPALTLPPGSLHQGQGYVGAPGHEAAIEQARSQP